MPVCPSLLSWRATCPWPRSGTRCVGARDRRGRRGLPRTSRGEIYRPAPPDRDDLVIAFSFASADALTAWENSAQRRRWIAAAEPLLTGEAIPHAISGFEGIFSLVPGRPVVPAPRWKTAVIIEWPCTRRRCCLTGPWFRTWLPGTSACAFW